MIDGANNFLISSAIGTLVCNYANLNLIYSSAVGTLIFSVLASDNFIENISMYAIYVLVGILGFWIYKSSFFDKFINRDTTFLEIYDTNNELLYFYMKEFPEFYPKRFSFRMGNDDVLASNANSPAYILPPNQKIPFHDKNFDLDGYIETKEIKVDKGGKKEEKITRNYIITTIHVYHNEKNIMAFQYYKMIEKKRLEIINKSASFYINYMRYFDQNGEKRVIEHTIFNGMKNDLPKIFEKQLGSFFHKEKGQILDRVTKIIKNPEFFTDIGQPASLNLLLEGPPGSGKSTLAYRLAMSFGLDIYSIDVSAYKTKYDLHQVFYYRTGIVLLEEFDIAVQKLYERSLKKKSVIDYGFQTIGSSNNVISSIKSKKDDDSSTISSYSTILKSLSDDDEVRLEDLLEILQGPVPSNGRITIATTNKYEEIKRLCPALFRAGRLTPVYFGYLERAEINEMGRFYFGSDAEIIDFDPNIQTSQLIEYAITAKIRQNPKYFYNQIKKHYGEKIN